MKSNNTIAILLGAYNAEKYIAEQIESVINQTYKDWILYVRDDASQDKTKDIIEHYATIDSRIVVINDMYGNLKCNGNYFHILQLIDSEYYMFCNADDFWLPNKIEISYKRLKEIEEKNLDKPIIVHTDLSITDEKLNIIYKSLWDYDKIIPEQYANYNDIGVCCIVAGATAIFNKNVKDITFPVHPNAPFFDHWMALQTTKNGGIISSVHQPLIYYRQIGSNLAAIVMGEENSVKNKLKNITKVISVNLKEANMLKSIGWGGYIKYIYYKSKLIFKTRILN